MHSTVGTLTKCSWGLRNAIPPKVFFGSESILFADSLGLFGPVAQIRTESYHYRLLGSGRCFVRGVRAWGRPRLRCVFHVKG